MSAAAPAVQGTNKRPRPENTGYSSDENENENKGVSAKRIALNTNAELINRVIKITTVTGNGNGNGDVENNNKWQDRRDCVNSIDTIKASGTAMINKDTYSIFDLSQRAALLVRAEKMCHPYTVEDIQRTIGDVIVETSKRGAAIVNPLNPENERTLFFFETFLKTGILLYIATQLGTTCVSDFLLAMFFHADFIRHLFYKCSMDQVEWFKKRAAGAAAAAGAAGGAGAASAAPAAAGDDSFKYILREYFRTAGEKWGGILYNQDAHATRLMKDLEALYTTNTSAIAAMVERAKSGNVTRQGDLLRRIINNMDSFIEGVTCKHLTFFLKKLFVENILNIFNDETGYVGYKDYRVTYKSGLAPDINDTAENADKVGMNLFDNVFAIMLHVNPALLRNKANPTTLMYHAIGYIRHNGIWYYVDNELGRPALPVPEREVRSIYDNISTLEMFNDTMIIPMGEYYSAVGAKVNAGWDNVYVHQATVFHASDTCVKMWDKAGRDEADAERDMQLIVQYAKLQTPAAAPSLPTDDQIKEAFAADAALPRPVLSSLAEATPPASPFPATLEAEPASDENAYVPALAVPHRSLSSYTRAAPILDKVASIVKHTLSDASLAAIEHAEKERSKARNILSSIAELEGQAEAEENAVVEAKIGEEIAALESVVDKAVGDAQAAEAAAKTAVEADIAAEAGHGAGASGGRRRRFKHRTYRKRKHSKTKHSKTKHSKTKAKRRKTRHSRKN